VTTTTSFGNKFLEAHLTSIAAGKIDEMVDRDYAENAVLITFFNGFQTPAPLTIKGREAIKKFFHEYLNLIGTINVKSLNLTETEDTIFFQATFTCNLGLVTVGDAWTIQNSQIVYHFGFWA
jgi:hypothetical protein